MEITRIFDLLENMEKNFQKDDIIVGYENGAWKPYSTQDYISQVNFFSCGLLALGFKAGDKIATIVNNRPQWNIIDMGMAQIGVIHVPLYPNITESEYEYLFKHSEAKAVIAGNKVIYNRVVGAVRSAGLEKMFFTVDEIETERSFQEIINLGKENASEKMAEVEEVKTKISKDDVVTIIYTSGTTGTPKGVMLSHYNFISNVFGSVGRLHLNHDHRALSFLPLCHVFERMVNYLYQYMGISIYYARNMGTIASDLREIQANIFSSVPRVLEKVFDNILSKGSDLTGLKRKIFFWAVNLGLHHDPHNKYGILYSLKLKIARKLVFSKWLEALGGQVSVIATGGSALQERLARVFWAAGIQVQEGYGLTETSPVIAVNDFVPGGLMIGTVGPVIDQVEVKIADDGEILVKGPGIMKGYYRDEENTKEVIDSDGWFHTGDIGLLVDDKFLKITDRKKSLFKLSGGKYIAPQVIENHLKESEFIEQVMVVGEYQKAPSAIISPNFDALHVWAAKKHIHYKDNAHLISLKEVVQKLRNEINQINKILSPHEQIKKFVLVKDQWSADTGELSATLKVKRDVVAKKYEEQIKGLFEEQI